MKYKLCNSFLDKNSAKIVIQRLNPMQKKNSSSCNDMFERHDACCSSTDKEFSCTPDELQDANKAVSILGVSPFQK